MNALTRTDALNRALIGFDTLFDALERSSSVSYPPYNIQKVGENTYDIAIAVTGFEKDEITVEIEANHLTVRSERQNDDHSNDSYLYRGLAMRNFERSFTLAEHMKVRKAELKNGILLIQLEREIPEELKARVIDIVEIK